MNKLLKYGFLAGFLLISASLMSKDKDFTLSFGNVTAKTLNFEVSNAQNISLLIYNDVDGELFSEKTGVEDHIAKSYDLANLSTGTYYLVAESDYKIEKYKISISRNNTMLVEKTPVTDISKPQYNVSGNVVKLHMSGLKNGIQVSVSDFSDNVYYTSNKKSVDGEFDLTFNLNPNTSENYIISVEQNGNTFNKVISLRPSF
ncbi:hypothetical protein [Chryseobacterium tongliaoense]|uniref:hypothetical protein n=1 Tax=Chryseobacterium tongliaoense TaxID=3240933 RepID=UPI003518DC42